MKEKTKIEARVVADSVDPRGNRLTSVLVVMPRIIIAEMNTHRMLSKNTSSSRAIPFKKMLQAIKENPFIPIDWQKEHSGMQGSEYFNSSESEILRMKWLRARDRAIESALDLAAGVFDVNEVFEYDEEGELIVLQTGIGVTKQLVNRLLEPFMWTTMLITGSKEGWDNFFDLRCPQYLQQGKTYKSKKEAIEIAHSKLSDKRGLPSTDLDWLRINKGQAEIHLMDLAEKIYDAMDESNPKQLQSGEWHIPFEDNIDESQLDDNFFHTPNLFPKIEVSGYVLPTIDEIKVRISTAMAARTSYTVVGDEKEVKYSKMIELHDRLIAQNPPHSSPMEHCARAMSDEEYFSYHNGLVEGEFDSHIEIGSFFRILEEPKFMEDKRNGWCRNYKGFIQYRHLVEKDLIYKKS